jgi:hypothetical protein
MINFKQLVSIIAKLDGNVTEDKVANLPVIDLKGLVRYALSAGKEFKVTTAPEADANTTPNAGASPEATADGSASATVEPQSMEDQSQEAEEAYGRVEEKLGGRAEIEMHKERSVRLAEEVKRRLGKKDPWRHDVIVHHLGLEGLIDVGKNKIKPQFDALVNKVADKFRATAVIPDVKGKERSEVKVNVKYGGDASQLSDILQATLRFKMHRGVLKEMYDAVEHLVYMHELGGMRATVTFFEDRYQKRFRGGYKDLLCLIKINGYTCELQLNIDEILDIKESLGHKQYELSRKVNDELIYAAMKGNLAGLEKALKEKADPNANRDMYGLTAIHYAAHHGNIDMIKALIVHKADVFPQDPSSLNLVFCSECR